MFVVDTNILLYAVDRSSPAHTPADNCSRDAEPESPNDISLGAYATKSFASAPIRGPSQNPVRAGTPGDLLPHCLHTLRFAFLLNLSITKKSRHRSSLRTHFSPGNYCITHIQPSSCVSVGSTRLTPAIRIFIVFRSSTFLTHVKSHS